MDAKFDDANDVENGSKKNSNPIAMCIAQLLRNKSKDFQGISQEAFAKEMIPRKHMEEEQFPLFPPLIQKEQQSNKGLQKQLKKLPNKYGTAKLEEAELVTCIQ